MKHFVSSVLLAVGLVLPLAAGAQPAPPPPDQMGPPPAMTATMDKIHAAAKTSAYGALTPDHRAKVQAIVDQVKAGTVTPRDGGAQIDALLTPDEKTAVLAASKKAHEDMRAAMSAAGYGPPDGGGGGPPGGPPPGAGPPPGGGPPDGGPGGMSGRHRPTPTAGRELIMLSMTPEQMRGMMRGPHN